MIKFDEKKLYFSHKNIETLLLTFFNDLRNKSN